MHGGRATGTLLPKEYHKKYLKDFDTQFLVIVLISAIVHFGTVGYFVAHPAPIQIQPNTSKGIQEQFAYIILEREAENIALAKTLVKSDIVQNKKIEQAAGPRSDTATPVQDPNATSTISRPVAENFTTKSDSPIGTGPTGNRTHYTTRQELRNQIDRQVANKGILEVLSSQSNNATNNDVQDILGSNSEASMDYDRAFQNLDRYADQSQPGTGEGSGGPSSGTNRDAVKGERATTGSGITTIISGIAPSGAADKTRSSDFIESELAVLSNNGNNVEMEAIMAGARDVDKVKAVVQAHTQAIEYCYQRERKRKPDLKGKIAVRFTILPSGKVKDPKILSSTINSQNVERCLLSRISRWDDFGKINPSKGNASFRQIYTFGF